jgi:ribosomal protein S1
MENQPPLRDHSQDTFTLGVPSMLETWKHHCTLLTHELDEVCRELVSSRRRVAQLVAMHDKDQLLLKHQQARIVELEADVKRLKDKLITLTAHEVAGTRATLYESAYKGA